MATDALLEAKFDSLVDSFDPSDSISVEDANVEMRKYWLKFLQAGFDANVVTGMLAPEDVLAHHEALVDYGANFDIDEFISALDEEFIEKHWNGLVKAGANPDSLIDRVYGDYVFGDYGRQVNSIGDLEDLSNKGVSAEKSLTMIESWLKFREDRPEEREEVLVYLMDHGLSRKAARKSIEDNMDSYMVEYIVESDSAFFKEIGINSADYVDRWIKSHKGYYSLTELDSLPKSVSVVRFLGAFSMREIIDESMDFGFEYFIEDWLKYDEIDTLAQRFLDEIGYTTDLYDAEAMLDLVLAGASIIDTKKVVESVDFSQYDEDDVDSWHWYLREVGYEN